MKKGKKRERMILENDENMQDFNDDLDFDNDDFDNINTNDPSLNFNDSFSDDFYSPSGSSPIDKHKDLLKDLTNFDSYLKDIFHHWLGITWDDSQEAYVRDPKSKPILSVEGARFCVNFLKTYTRQNNIITHIGMNEYNNMVSDIINVLWYNLGTRKELGFQNKLITQGDLLTICSTLQHAAELVLMGAGDGKYNKWLSTTYSHHTTGSLNPQMQGQNFQEPQPLKKQSFMSNLKKALIG